MKKHLEAIEGLPKIPHEELITGLEDIMEDDSLLTQAVLARLPFSELEQIPHALKKPTQELLEMLLGIEAVVTGSSGEYTVAIESIDMEPYEDYWQFEDIHRYVFDIRFKYRREPSFYYGETYGIRFDYHFTNATYELPREKVIKELLRIAQSVWAMNKPWMRLDKLSGLALETSMKTVGGIY